MKTLSFDILQSKVMMKIDFLTLDLDLNKPGLYQLHNNICYIELNIHTYVQHSILILSADSSELLESEDDLLDAELRKSISSTIYATLCQGDSSLATPEQGRRQRSGRGRGVDFSPVESLESSFSLGMHLYYSRIDLII